MSKYSFRIPVRSREIFYRFIRCSITYRQWLARLHGSSRDRGSQRRANYTMFRVTRCGSRGGCPFRIRWQPEGGGRRKANPEFLLSFPSQFYRARNRKTANQPTNQPSSSLARSWCFSPAKNSVHLGPMKSQAAANEVGGGRGSGQIGSS